MWKRPYVLLYSNDVVKAHMVSEFLAVCIILTYSLLEHGEGGHVDGSKYCKDCFLASFVSA